MSWFVLKDRSTLSSHSMISILYQSLWQHVGNRNVIRRLKFIEKEYVIYELVKSLCLWLTNGNYQFTCVIISLCTSLIDGTKTLTEIVVTSINEALRNLSKKIYLEQILKQHFSIISLKI